MTIILHLSDLHFGPPSNREALSAAVSLAQRLEPSAIVVSGDFTQRAKASQFRDAKRYLQELERFPLLVVPGNHDIPLYRIVERLFSPYGLYKKYISPSLETFVATEDLLLVGINSTHPYTRITDSSFSRKSFLWAGEMFARHGTHKLCCLISHHELPFASDYQLSKSDGERENIFEYFAKHGVKVFLSGHYHRSFSGSVKLSLDQEKEQLVYLSQCGTSASLRGRDFEKNICSCNVIDAREDHLRVKHLSYSEVSKGFDEMSTHTFSA